MSDKIPEIHGLTPDQIDQVDNALTHVAEKAKAEGIEIGRLQTNGSLIEDLPEAKFNPQLAKKMANDPSMTIDKAKEYLTLDREDQLKRVIRAI